MARLRPEQWAALKAEWSTGRYSGRELAEKYGISHVAIHKRAKKEGWEQLDQALVDEFVEHKVKVSKEIEKVSAVNNLETSSLEAALDELARFEIESAKRMATIDDVAFSRLHECDKVADIKAIMDIHVKRREALLGKRPDTAIQINNSAPQAVEVRFVDTDD